MPDSGGDKGVNGCAVCLYIPVGNKPNEQHNAWFDSPVQYSYLNVLLVPSSSLL